MVTKSFRIDEKTIEQLSLLQKVNNISFQDVVTNAINDYLERNLENFEINMHSFDDSSNEISNKNTDYMFIPIDIYAMFNDLTRRDVEVQIQKKLLDSISLGQTVLIMININNKHYKKTELLLIKHSMNTIRQEYRRSKAELMRQKKEIEKLFLEIEEIKENKNG